MSIDGLRKGVEMQEKKISGLECRTTEFTQTGQEREKKNRPERKWTEPQGPVRQQLKSHFFMSLHSQMESIRVGWNVVWKNIG